MVTCTEHNWSDEIERCLRCVRAVHVCQRPDWLDTTPDYWHEVTHYREHGPALQCSYHPYEVFNADEARLHCIVENAESGLAGVE